MASENGLQKTLISAHKDAKISYFFLQRGRTAEETKATIWPSCRYPTKQEPFTQLK